MDRRCNFSRFVFLPPDDLGGKVRPQAPCECGSPCVWVAAEVSAAVAVERRMKRRKQKPTLTINKVKMVELVPCVHVKNVLLYYLLKL